MNIVAIDPHVDLRWRNFVEAHPDGSIYHHPAWLRALSAEYGQHGKYLACENAKGEILAVMPLIYTKGLPFRLGGRLGCSRLSSLPRTPIAGPLSNASEATLAILDAVMSEARKDNLVLQIKTQGPELIEILPDLVCAPWRFSYVLNRGEGSDAAFRVPGGRDRARIKWAVNKATRLGVRVRSATEKRDLHAWYQLYASTMRRNTVLPRSRRFFDALWDSLMPLGMMELLLAELRESGGKRVISGAIFLKFHRTVSYAYSGSSQKDHHSRANDLIQWEAINDAFRHGFDCFDFGEVPDDHATLASFKSKWGAEPVRLYRYYYPPQMACEPTASKTTHLLGQTLPTVWARLPVPLTVWLGDRLYSYL